MQYVNPYSLLAIEPGSPADIPKAVRTAKKRVLAEIELDGQIPVDGVSVDKTLALRVIDELDDENKRRFHAAVFFDEAFRLFLSGGQTGWLYPEDMQDYILEDDFLKFIAPFYFYRFNKTLEDAIATGDVETAANLILHELPAPKLNNEQPFASAKKHFEDILRDVKEKLGELEAEKKIQVILPPGTRLYEPSAPFYNPFTQPSRFGSVEKFERMFMSRSDVRIFNELPEEFQLMRDNFAGDLQNIAAIANNKLKEPEIAFQCILLSRRLKTGSSTEELAEGNFQVLSSLLNRKNFAALNSQLEDLKKKVKEKYFHSATEIYKTVELIFDAEILNNISSTATDNSIISAATNLIEIARHVNIYYYDPDMSLLIIKEALKLKLSDSNVSKALSNKLTNAYDAAEYSRDSIIGQVTTACERLIEALSFNIKIFHWQTTPAKLAKIAGGLILIGASMFGGFSTSKKSQGNSNYFQISNSFQISNNLQTGNKKNTAAAIPQVKIVRYNSGDILIQIPVKGLGKLTITNHLSNDAIVKLIDNSSGKTHREIYIRSDERFAVSDIKQGNYSLIFTTGRNYAPSLKKFLSDASYGKFDDTLNYTESRNSTGSSFRSYKTELAPIIYGVEKASNITESDFVNR